MGRRTTYSHGTFCWVDLSTPDVQAADDFYERVFGWSAEELPSGGYWMFERDEAAMAGLAALTEEQEASGMHRGWATYVSVDDVDALCPRVAELGGTVESAPFDVQGAGRMAAITDPQGARVLLWQPGTFAGAEVVNEVGAWSWNDLQTPDMDAAAAFYSQLLGWQVEDIPGAGGQYRTIKHEGRSIGGLMPLPPGVEAPAWNVYFGVHSAGATFEHVEAAGGVRVAGPIDVPAGRFGVATDPLGATFCVVEGQFDD
ncbi:MAG TPA: VOC family protein [Baekduia sp.]|nr:VOC family protein [Baekduia sp.]